MIVFRMRIAIPKEQLGAVAHALRCLIGPTNVLPGCIRCQLYQDTDDETVLTWVEEWDTREDLERRVRSNDFRTLLSILDLSTVEPDVRFDTVVPIAGMELIEDTRKGRATFS